MFKELGSFFSNGNGWELLKIKNRTYPAPLNSLLFEMLKNAFDDSPPYILPRLDAQKTLWFYICAEDNIQLQEIKGILKSSLGNSIVHFDPIDYKSTKDLCEAPLLTKFDFGFSRAFIPQVLNSNKPLIYKAIESLNNSIELYRSRPKTISTVKRPLGVILRSFFTGCTFGKHDIIDGALKEIKQQQSLSQRNLLSLEFQALFSKHNYIAVLDHPKFIDSINVTIPKVLQSVFLTSIYEAFKDSLENKGVVELRNLFSRFVTLFYNEPNLPQTGEFYREWKCWFIGHTLFGFSKADFKIPKNVDIDWANNFLKLVGVELAVIEVSTLKDNSKATIQDLLVAPPSVDVMKALVLGVANLPLTEQEEVYSVLCSHPTEIFEEMFSDISLQILWHRLEDEFKNAGKIKSWVTLFSALKEDATLYKEFRKSVTDNYKTWSSKDNPTEQVDNIILELIEPESIKALREVIPLFLGWLYDNNQSISPNSIEHLVFCLASDDIQNKEDLLLCTELLKLFISQAHDVKTYENILNCILECWEKVSSVDALDYAIEIIENLVDFPCASEQAKIELWTSVSQVALNYWKRLNQVQQVVIKELSELIIASSAHFPEIIVEDSEPEKLLDLSGQRLAIYTLTESAARRSSTILQTMYPGLEVRTNSDKSATEALTSLIKSADYFIFAARSAAHQAFNPLTNARKDIIYPDGKGSSSIVRAFKESVNIE